ncbi:hypothetical protein DL98DRAFT_508279 [Cadophora sp. DSE1049]|nr:hypothetical protein DL98DRAFT_508279 [Cadophora sp. DSE1049]
MNRTGASATTEQRTTIQLHFCLPPTPTPDASIQTPESGLHGTSHSSICASQYIPSSILSPVSRIPHPNARHLRPSFTQAYSHRA